MAFAFREVTISGNKVGVEGISAALNEITDVLVNEMGWELFDDRRTQAGNSNVTLTHKVVFRNNGGEDGTANSWYFTLTSGTGASVASNIIGFQMTDSYDVSTHDTSSSGVETPTSHNGGVTMTLDSNGIFNLWVSGNKDGLVFVNNRENLYGMLLVGKSKTFLDSVTEPQGLYSFSSTSSTLATTLSARTIAGNPPEAFSATSDSEILSLNQSSSNEPRIGLGNTDAIFTLLPLTLTVDDTTGPRKGFIGLLQNVWSVPPTSAGWIKESLVAISGSNQTYLAFPETSAGGIAIRKT